MLYLGIDVGGTGIKVALVDHKGRVRVHREMPTRAMEGPEAILNRVESLSRGLIGRFGTAVAACGVGSAGRIDHQRGDVIFASKNLPGWTGVSLAAELSRRLGIPVVADNDVNTAALAEGWIGGARGLPNYMMLTLGTGVGGAVVVDGKVWRGAHFGAGEVGHTVLYPGGLQCACGGTGCAEQYVSARALTRRANGLLISGQRFRGIRDVIGSALHGDIPRRTAARRAVGLFCGDLALLLVNLQQMLDPETILIGGGIVRLGYWWDRLLEAVNREASDRVLSIRVEAAHCGPQAGVVGAARMAMLTYPTVRRRSVPDGTA